MQKNVGNINLHAVMERLPELRAKLAHLVLISRSKGINVSVLSRGKRSPTSLCLMQEGRFQDYSANHKYFTL